MAFNYDIETLLEDAMISTLSSWLDDEVTVMRWDDIKDKELNPVVKVKAVVADEEPGTVNTFTGTSLLVDLGIFTSRRSDEEGRQANALRGQVRAFLRDNGVVTTLNITPGLFVYNNGVIPQASSDVEDSKNWHRSLTVLVVATQKDIT